MKKYVKPHLGGFLSRAFVPALAGAAASVAGLAGLVAGTKVAGMMLEDDRSFSRLQAIAPFEDSFSGENSAVDLPLTA